MNRNSIIAIFLVVIMLGSIFTVIMSGIGSDETNSGNIKNINNIPGIHAKHDLNSISDGLKFSPADITTAQYADFAKMKQSQMGLIVGDEINRTKIYGTEINKEFSAVDITSNGYTAFRANTIQGDKMDFTYISSEEYNGYELLNMGGDAYTVAGTPMLLGSNSSLKSVIDVLQGNAASCTKFDHLLSKVEPGAEYQMITDDQHEIADQYFLELRKIQEGGYERTSMFINPNQSVMDRMNLLAQNSSTRGLTYNISNEENITKVIVRTNNDSNFFKLIEE